MAAASKSSQMVKNVVLALLTLWSLISLVVIVVWATSPDLKGSAACRAELQEAKEKMEAAKVVWSKNKVAREEQLHQSAEILRLVGRLGATNATLEECRQEKVVLNGNISVLHERVEQLRQTEANHTARIGLQEEHIETLQQNLTQAGHRAESLSSLKAAAENHMQAAQSETSACNSRKEFLQKQLQKCKDGVPEATREPQKTDLSSSTSPLSGIPALTLLTCSSLLLMT
uniref:Uncharacterized protein n=1 Tax=Gasterosteus aculeatus aculeatus TaxID=481459 RepID=A0AAQ4R9F7_GASAC